MTIVHFRTWNEKKEGKKEEPNKREKKKNEERIAPWCSLFLENLSKNSPRCMESEF
jgi:hypothetical protein